MWQKYFTPTSLEMALQILAKYREHARIIAGGTDLLIELERKIRSPRVLIDITRIAGLDRISYGDGHIHLGPLVTHNQVAGSDVCVKKAYPLARACWEVGAPQIRNRGTVAGNLITASPANDTITPLWALGASVTLTSVRGERTQSFPEFFRGVRKTAMEPDEILTGVRFPALKRAERGTFIKLALRRAQAISVVNVAAIVSVARGRVARARITLGSVSPTIVRATQAEEFLAGKPLTDSVIAEAGELAVSSARPIDDIRGTAEYRREMVRVTTSRALTQLRDGAERDGYPENPVMLRSRFEPQSSIPDKLVHEEEGDQPIVTTVNGKHYEVYGANDKTLLRMLREDIGLTGTKEGCAEGECGACTVFMDGMAVMSCMVAAPRAHGAEIVTVEGLAPGTFQGLAPDGHLHPVQQAFIQEGAVQCGYCTPGFLMAGAKLLEENSSPSRWEIEQAIAGNLCRCTGYYTIVRAIEKAAQSAAGEPAGQSADQEEKHGL
jgi:xanthine dehydrogenase iron-sulfur cluster and FAD-binding subunit A